MGCRMNIKKLSSLLVTIMFLAGLTPLVLAATEDNLYISFDPDGDIDIDVDIHDYNISSQVGPVLANEWTNTTTSTFTIYNNGTVNMDVQIKTNASTDQNDMDLNASGVAPVEDEYAIFIEGLDAENYIGTAYGQELENNIPANGGTATFDVCLLLGTISTNHSLQNTTIYFQGSIAN